MRFLNGWNEDANCAYDSRTRSDQEGRETTTTSPPAVQPVSLPDSNATSPSFFPLCLALPPLMMVPSLFFRGSLLRLPEQMSPILISFSSSPRLEAPPTEEKRRADVAHPSQALAPAPAPPRPAPLRPAHTAEEVHSPPSEGGGSSSRENQVH